MSVINKRNTLVRCLTGGDTVRMAGSYILPKHRLLLSPTAHLRCAQISSAGPCTRCPGMKTSRKKETNQRLMSVMSVKTIGLKQISGVWPLWSWSTLDPPGSLPPTPRTRYVIAEAREKHLSWSNVKRGRNLYKPASQADNKLGTQPPTLFPSLFLWGYEVGVYSQFRSVTAFHCFCAFDKIEVFFIERRNTRTMHNVELPSIFCHVIKR